MAADFGVTFLGRVPIDPSFTNMVEAEGEGSYVKNFEKSNLFPVFSLIAQAIVGKTQNQ